jgi:hypothetical protein
VASVAAVVLAFLASQHHAIHMVLLMAVTGSAGMGFMAAYPAIRRGMLLLSLVAAAVALFVAWRLPSGGRTGAGGHATHARHVRWQRIASVVSVVLTLLLAGWSLYEFGL